MKQTAIDWLQHKMATSTPEDIVNNINEWFDKAKEMDKVERAKEYLRGFEDGKEYMKKIKTFKTK